MAQHFNSGGKRPYYKRHQGNQGRHRRNDRIRVPEVRVIGPEGGQLGVLKTQEALKLAKDVGLDLVEISPTARPPVCRIIDYGKFMYEEGKKQKGTKKSPSTKLKEVKFRLNIDDHDYETKLRRGEKFLNKGNKLKLTMFFRGREMEKRDRGFEIIKRAIADLEGVSTPDMQPKMVGRNISLTLSPLPEGKRKLKFNTEADMDAPDDHDDEEDHGDESDEE